jgi:quinohemoprotein ethanol dehydrogenase
MPYFTLGLGDRLLRLMGSVIVLVTLICSTQSATAENNVGATQDWTSHNADAGESAFSTLTQINAGNLQRLAVAAALDLDGEATLEATPLAIHGVLYFTGSYSTVYAVDGKSGELLWKFAPETWKHNPNKMHFTFPVNRGVAYADGRIFSAALDGRLFGLDARTGKLLWTVETTAADSLYTITGAPRTFNGKVIIGNGGGDLGARGYVTAYDAATGNQQWRFYTVPGSPEQNRGDPAMARAAATWHGKYWSTGTGGTVWDGITFDPQFNRIYIGTANASPMDPAARSPGGGDNLYTASIVALDADTGKYVWHYQVNPRDSWDFDSTPQMTLADLVINGQHRKVLLQAPKNGFFYVLDRQTGKLISAEKLGKVTWADHIDLATGRPVEAPNIRFETSEVIIWPSPVGAHAFQAMSYDPETKLVYIPYMQSGVRFLKGAPQQGAITVGGISIAAHNVDAMDGKGALIAWDPVHQKAAWKVRLDTLWNGGTLATAGGLVFQGTADGYFSAYDANTGARLWHFNAGMGILGSPMSYAEDGKQYIAILVGYGGSAAIWGDLMNVGWKYSQTRRLLIFALDGEKVLPAATPPDMSVKAVDDPSIKLNPADVASGHDLFFACAVCHGRNLVAAGAPAPDLRESAIALNPEGFWAVLHGGALLSKGMPQFENLTRPEVAQLYAYIRAGAREARNAPRAP